MPLFLEAPGHGHHGPDGRGWNRLSLNAHIGKPPHQCGLLPTNYASLLESMTGRQRWGGFHRCSQSTPSPGRCEGCPVQQRHLEGDGVAWPERTPLLLARIRPLPPSPGGMFINATAGLSKLELHAWHGAPTGVEADWRTVRNTTALRLGRRFRDEDGEAFWLVRDNPAASPDLVRSRRYRTHTRHALYGGQDQGRLALLICHGRCTHTADALEQLAADLGARPAGSRAAPTPPLPRRLAGAPGIELQEENGHTTLDRHDYAARFTWDVPLDAVTVTALAAHTVRLTAS